MRTTSFLALLLTAGCATTQPSDPHRWLEGIDDPRALAWVAEQNERTQRHFTAMPGFEEMRQQALTALNSASRVPNLEFHGPHLYNIWKDARHPRGLYRRTTLSDPWRWTTVLDIDELSRAEGKPWVLKGVKCLPPEQRRCLFSLSPGGGDAVEIREFDTGMMRFVENGFFVPLAKTNVSWLDENTLFIGTDFGPGSVTEAGYARILKRWARGTPLAAAATIYEGSRSSVSAYGRRIRMEAGNIDLVEESLTFWTKKRLLIEGATLRPLPLPETAILAGGYGGRLVVALQDNWNDLRGGSVVMVDPLTLKAELLVASTPTVIVQTTQVEVTDKGILVPVLENVRARLYRFRPGAEGEQIAFPDNGALEIMTTDDETGDALVSFETFVTPPALYHVPASASTPTLLLAQEPAFDGSRFDVVQQWTTSKDGTRVPYFVVAPKGMKRDGTNPVHIFSYGGFRSALTPSYSGSYEAHYGAYGKLWLGRGGVFVLANIRGGAEFGPAWHSSVLKENRHKSFEDFEAVAEDLVRTGITTRARLGIEGRSNGGLLTLAAMIRRPELYGAVISGAPLSDMARYHEMLAGASWIAEYGDPRVPAEWAVLRAYSPYQNLRRGAPYPPLLIYASTRDDRVHPGHARKTVARLLEMGHEVWYFENVEGGHGGSSTNEQLAYRIALSYAHLWSALRGSAPVGGM